GPYELGVVHVDVASAAGNPAEDFSVARVKRQILERSSVGAIYTRRATSPDGVGFAPDDRHTAGFDFNFSTASLFGDQNLDGSAFAVWNSNPDPAVERSFGDLSSRGVRL